MQHNDTLFNGNVNFYNDPRYRAANLAFYSALDLLKQCGMKHEQARDWIKGWGVLENNDGDEE